jgi:hypothetical protein
MKLPLVKLKHELGPCCNPFLNMSMFLNHINTMFLKCNTLNPIFWFDNSTLDKPCGINHDDV